MGCCRASSQLHLFMEDGSAGNDCIFEKSGRLSPPRPGWALGRAGERCGGSPLRRAARAHDDTRLAHHPGLLRWSRLPDLVGRFEEQGHGGGLLPRGPQSGLVDHRCLDLRLQHRLRAHRRPRRVGREGRRGAGALRAARLVSAGARLGVRAVLLADAGLHDAGVPRAALLGRLAVRALNRLAHHLAIRRLLRSVHGRADGKITEGTFQRATLSIATL